ncbi:MAG: hypothetical protein RMJ98_01740 [Myxococcales bacterium]|nr:hypothetical protein [Polyangiaceae bacterium]MDW8248009.1 hypothetical protein [Myxococcales bacterium]
MGTPLRWEIHGAATELGKFVGGVAPHAWTTGSGARVDASWGQSPTGPLTRYVPGSCCSSIATSPCGTRGALSSCPPGARADHDRGRLGGIFTTASYQNSCHDKEGPDKDERWGEHLPRFYLPLLFSPTVSRMVGGPV